ncbi:putative dynein heavy chain 12, axonemal isoform X5 [Penaeus vannamei]|uniref:Putative dynein heavy chain 12, axonemal isoform X5 n=1 Tax=Penaeus vannamei TaxID=6689 RepID=A0A423TZ58_PENVA|nr:putative dynein heavy chain 12, axonemal isoform X5 [Penaeus vannamei]
MPGSAFRPSAAHALPGDTIARVFTTAALNVFSGPAASCPTCSQSSPGVISGPHGVLDHVQNALRPTPTKSHYTFSLATAARIVNSISFLKKESMETKRHFVRVWVHEVYREVCDRLTEAPEVTEVYQLLMKTIRTSFRDKIHVIFDKICNEDGSKSSPRPNALGRGVMGQPTQPAKEQPAKEVAQESHVTEACLERVCWGVMGSLDTPAAERRYEELIDAAQLRQTVAAFVEEYNGQHKTQLNLVTFKYVVQHVSRICRILGRAGGHMMLVGVGGSGRRSLTHLAAHICGHRLVHPRIIARDGYSDLRRVLKDALIAAGVEEKATVVLVGDEVLQHPSILHLLNTLILTGDVPNLLSPEDHSYLLERVGFGKSGKDHLISPFLPSLLTTSSHLLNPLTNLTSPHPSLTPHLTPPSPPFISPPPSFPSPTHLTSLPHLPHPSLTPASHPSPSPHLPHLTPSPTLPPQLPPSLLTPQLPHPSSPPPPSPSPPPSPPSSHPSSPSSHPLFLLQRLRLYAEDRGVTETDLWHEQAQRVADLVHVVITAPPTPELRHVFASYPPSPPTSRRLFQGVPRPLHRRQTQVTAVKKKYLSGLDKLAFAASQISVMQEMLASLGPQIEEATQDVSKMMEIIEQESLEVEERRKLVSAEEEEAGVHAANARALQEECQAELNQAMPALHEAVEALNTLKPADITVVKSMKNPPQAIKLVMAAVCVMLEIKPEKMKNSSGKTIFEYWGPSKRLLGDMSFLQQLKDYDKDNIPEAVMDKINKEYVRLPEFDPASVAKASSAAEGLCKWIVAPKRERLAEAEEEVRERMGIVEGKRNELRQLEEKLENLQRRFSLACREKEKLENEQKLWPGGERSRWEGAAETAGAELLRLPGDTLLAAASLAYLPPHQPEIRERVLAEWSQAVLEAELEVTTPFSLVDILTPPLHVRAWGLEGLPTDAFSLQNATAIKHTVKWPYLVDPDEQGTRWLQLHEAANELVVLREQDFNAPASRPGGGAVAQITLLEDALARCIPKGRPVLLMDLAGDPPSQLADLDSPTKRPNQPLFPELPKGGVRVVTIGSLTLQYHPGFRLYLASRHARPSLSLETAASLTVVNFTVTVQGLHDNLRQILVRKERPELEDERQKLVLTTSSHQRALQDTEERILHTLSSAQGNILESEEAINILQETKQMSDEIKRKQEQCVETEAALLECCKQYESVSRPAASLYITLASLASVSPMYQFSLRWYVDLYVAVIDTTGKSSVLERRLSLLQEALVSRVHSAVVKGLAAPHRLPFTFLIALHALRVSGAVSPSVESALYRLASLSPAGCAPPPDWLAPPLAPAWPALLHLSTLPEFEGLSESLEKDAVGWVSLTSSALPEKSSLPRPWHRLQPVLWLLLVAALRLDKLTWAVRAIVGEILGAHFSSPPPVDVGVFLEAPVQPKSSSRAPAPARPPPPSCWSPRPGSTPWRRSCSWRLRGRRARSRTCRWDKDRWILGY